jgi:hypothetical protein
MREHERRLKQESEEGSAVRPRDKAPDAPRSDRPQRTTSPGAVSLPRSLQAAGNAAIDHLLDHPGSGRPLDPATRAKMEAAFGADLGQVRVHDDAPAAAATDAFGASAFTRGADIHVGRDAPPLNSPPGKELLAHELAHVVQQRRAGTVDPDRVSQPGDALEQAADGAARQALRGGRAAIAGPGAVPAVQRQMADPTAAYRAEIQQVLESFLRRVLAAQGGQRLRVTRVVGNALMTLAGAGRPGSPGPRPDSKRGDRLARIEAYLNRPALPGKADEFAKEAVQHLPNPVDRAALYDLLRMPVAESASSDLGSRLSERPAPTQLDQLEPGRPSVAQERSEQREAVSRRWADEEEPTKIGPVSPQAVVKGASDVLAPTPAPRVPEAQPQTYASVEQAIRGLAPAMQGFARQVARELDLAFQRHRGSAEVDLPGSARGRDPASGDGEIDRIVRLIRDSLPHRAAGVRHVRIYVGNRFVRTIALAAGSK